MKTKMKNEYLDTIDKCTSKLLLLSYELIELSISVYKAGNDYLAERLHTIAEDIEASRTGINNAVAKEINRQFKQSNETSKTIFESALAGAKIGKNENRNRTKNI